MPSISMAPLSGRYLSFSEREQIALARAHSCGVREIARQLGRSPSTISPSKFLGQRYVLVASHEGGGPRAHGLTLVVRSSPRQCRGTQ
jgi:hypothetical protein